MATRGATLKMVKEIKVAFDPFNGHAGVPIAREFLRRVSSPKLLESNPKFKLSSEVKCDGSVPLIQVTFANKEVQEFDITNTRFDDVYAQFIKTCKQKE